MKILSKLKNNFIPIVSIAFSAMILIIGGILIFIFLNLKSKINLVAPIVEIKPGQTSKEIAQNLKKQGIIKNKNFFDLYLRFLGLDKKIQAGEYDLQNQTSVEDLLRALLIGARKKEITFTIPEGWTTKQIAALLLSKNLTSQNKFEQLASEVYLLNAEGINLSLPKYKNFSFLDDKFANPQSSEEQKEIVDYDNMNLNLEGYLFPDTYRVYEETKASEIIEKMLARFASQLTSDLRLEIKRQNKTISQVVIIASILEREVQTEKDMRLSADILWRRLNADMALEVDSTLNYVLADDDRRVSLTYDQLKIDSPYNTYKYKGLPPTAISNPGLKAIKAAIYPLANRYWYFLSKANGETVFAETLVEQERNKKRFLK